MKRIQNTILSTLLAIISMTRLEASTEAEKIKAEMERLVQLDTSLNRGGITTLLEDASQKSIAAPLINSQYFAERIAKQEPALAPLEQAKRSFGFKVAQELEKTAAANLQQSTSEQRIQQATQLLDLADWLKTQKGYGNYILVTRCENLAAIPLGYLTGDLTFPMDKIATQRKRITPSQEQREFRRTVLNSEADAPFIGVLKGTEEQQNYQMQLDWGDKWHAMADWFKARNIRSDKWKRSDLPPELALFFEDELGGPKTTVQSWNMNLHHGIVMSGLREKNIENIDGFAKYREIVGKFPTEPPKWWKPDDRLFTKTKAAFFEAWEPYVSEHGPHYGVAYIVYEQVTTGKLMDDESFEIEFATKQKQRLEK